MNYNIISTGSQGNAIVVDGKILIDCGIPFKKLAPYVKDLKIVLLTHIHGDHFNKATIRKLAKERPALRFACGKWLIADLLQCGVSPSKIDVCETSRVYNYGWFQLSNIKLYHDVENCGWRLFLQNEKAIYITDTSTVQGIVAKNYNLYMIEANYEENELQERIKAKQEAGVFAYEYRVPKTHLSKEECDQWLLDNIGENSEAVYLHQHQGKEE